MREENRIDAFEFFSDVMQERNELPRRKTRVDQHARAFGDEQGRVARAAAALWAMQNDYVVA